MKMCNSGKPLNNATISEFEEQLNIRLPQDYKNFMLENNGGTPEKDWAFDFVDVAMETKTSSTIRSFSVIYDEETYENDLRKSYRILQELEEVPPYFLPIADDPGGNLICMCVSETYFGRIFFCDHELDDPETGYILMSKIADFFAEFIDNCYKFIFED